jgi:hypothetical protein
VSIPNLPSGSVQVRDNAKLGVTIAFPCRAFSNGAFFLADSDPYPREVLCASIIPVHGKDAAAKAAIF